jgi:uncharacterized protein YbjT (DUF2867 family)
MKTALIFGATGLIGKKLIEKLSTDSRYAKIKIFLRKDTLGNNEKFEKIFIDFDTLERYADLIKGDDLFCCLGTTMKKAKTKEVFRKVDYHLPKSIAAIAERNQVNKFLVISSVGADAHSSNFYLRTKGEMELKIQEYRFSKLAILRPSMLLGEREEFRPGEAAGKLIMRIFSPFFIGKWKKYKPINASVVAKAMIEIANDGGAGGRIVESHQIQQSVTK